MDATPDSRALNRRRQNARLAVLKRRTAVASALGFAALFGLVTQHVVKGASAGTAATPSPRSATANNVPFFDANASGFAFDEGSGATAPQSAAAPPPPVAQTSVS